MYEKEDSQKLRKLHGVEHRFKLNEKDTEEFAEAKLVANEKHRLTI